MQRSVPIFTTVICVHLILYFSIRNFVVFQSVPSSPDSISTHFQRIALALVKPKTAEPPSEATKAAAPSFSLVQAPAPAATASIVLAPSITPSFSVSAAKPQIPNLSDTIMRGVSGTGGTGSGPAQGAGGVGTSQSANLFGMDVKSDGPITAFLDTSESLKSEHDAVKAEIVKLLPTSSIVEINGGLFVTRANLEQAKSRSILSEYYANYYLSLVDGSIIPRIMQQIKDGKLTGPMTIYYFSDFEDYADRKDVDAFSQLLQENHIRFYAYSVKKDPSDATKRMCEATGGSWKVQSPSSP